MYKGIRGIEEKGHHQIRWFFTVEPPRCPCNFPRYVLTVMVLPPTSRYMARSLGLDSLYLGNERAGGGGEEGDECSS